ncbi:MAG TPA: flagellar basal body-associated FliL family protein [bacterium]
MAKKSEATETAQAADESAAASKSSGLMTKIGIIAAVLLIQIAGSYFLQKTFLFQNAAAGNSKVEEKKPEPSKESDSEMSVIMLDEIVVNPAETGGRRYLVVSLGLQTTAPEAEKSIEKFKPLIRDALISLLSSKHMDELSRISYRDTLRAEIKEATNRELRKIKVDNVVFSSYVLQ